MLLHFSNALAMQQNRSQKNILIFHPPQSSTKNESQNSEKITSAAGRYDSILNLKGITENQKAVSIECQEHSGIQWTTEGVSPGAPPHLVLAWLQTAMDVHYVSTSEQEDYYVKTLV